MPLYGTVAAAKAMLRADGASTFSADQDARLTALQKAVSLYIEQATGRQFGIVTIEQVAVRRRGQAVYTLMLPKPVRTITAVTLDPVNTGTAWSGGTALPLSGVERAMITVRDEALALVRSDGDVWPMLTVVTGNWADSDSDTAVPDDITYVANYLMAERFKLEQASPSGQIGPDGSVVPIRDALRDSMVRETVDKYAINRIVI